MKRRIKIVGSVYSEGKEHGPMNVCTKGETWWENEHPDEFSFYYGKYSNPILEGEGKCFCGLCGNEIE